MFLNAEILSIYYQHGWKVVDDYEVLITRSVAGEYRSLVHAIPKRTFAVHYILDRAVLWSGVKAMYHRCWGRLAGFRVLCPDDHTTRADGTSAPTPLDQVLPSLSATTYQLVKAYGQGGAALSIGLPVRTIYKPVAGTVRVAVAGVEVLTGWTLDDNTGIITFDVAPVGTVTAGCQFHIPVRFDSALPTTQDLSWGDTGELILVELINRADVV